MRGYLGIDVGSVSTDLAVIDEKTDKVVGLVYIRTKGQPVVAVQEGLKELLAQFPNGIEIIGAGTTGSARNIAGLMINADLIKNEITAHAKATAFFHPKTRTVFEIGGQDSKLILLENGRLKDFAMNTVCAAGTGSFLDQQAGRLGITIEEFSNEALKSEVKCRISGRCAVFAESDMIHKANAGYRRPDIVYGLCEALVRNFLNNLAKGKELKSPIVFQGGVAANAGMVKAFGETVGIEIIVPEYHHCMGAIGSSLLAKLHIQRTGLQTTFSGFDSINLDFSSRSFNCDGCENECEISTLMRDDEVLA
ncbi:MAG: Activator of (R)-2-hydroxyglutaryl-CoA dehydratase HgdC, partial [candidate division CPR2 bacterium GW2011_GWD2_39_7]